MSAFFAKKSLGQYFLTNPHVGEWMAESADVSSKDHVVEIGPGTGVLTREFLSRGAAVTALEADSRAVTLLSETFQAEIANGQLHLIHGDVRTFDPCTLQLKAGTYKCIANIPYYLSGMLFRLFLESACAPSTLIFLVQKEVAERIARSPKESILSLSVKAYGTPRYIRTVGRGNFNPHPAVDSAILAVTTITKEHFTNLDEKFFFSLLHIGFGAKRKQLLGNLSKTYPRDTLIHIFSALTIPLDVRGEDLSLEKWLELSAVLADSSPIHT